MKKDSPPAILLDHGNHEGPLAFQKAEVAYDITFRFCHRDLAKGARPSAP
ncbi:MAG: hypothetical protein LBI02_00585 [Opitutaceae bacterium]|jgi:hypothetical protein|nr:hypothetical protein [Opitutaceae bacterium]